MKTKLLEAYMNTTAESKVGREKSYSAPSSAFPASAQESTGLDSEAIANTNQQLFSNLLDALLQDRDEEETEKGEGRDHVAPIEGARMAVYGCEKLTNEIIRLENLRQSIAHLRAQHSDDAGTSKEILQILLEAYDRKIRDCEDQLDRSLERYRKSTTSCGILVDYYLG